MTFDEAVAFVDALGPLYFPLTTANASTVRVVTRATAKLHPTEQQIVVALSRHSGCEAAAAALNVYRRRGRVDLRERTFIIASGALTILVKDHVAGTVSTLFSLQNPHEAASVAALLNEQYTSWVCEVKADKPRT